MSDTRHPPEVTTPACEKCRGHRAKCDRTRPVCNRCHRLGYECAYPVKHAATAFVNHAFALELQIAQLEQSLAAARQQQPAQRHQQADPDRVSSPPAQPSAPVPVAGDSAAPGTSRTSRCMSSPTLSEYLITDLFANAEPLLGEPAVSKVKNLVNGLAQVSLSAMTAPEEDSDRAGPEAASHDLILHTLILSAVAAPMPPSDEHLPSLALPHMDIASKVCERYCADLLVEFPCLAPQDVQRHLQQAYGEPCVPLAAAGADAERGRDGRNDRHYSMFVMATILATTAIALSPSSASKATALFLSGVQFLESVFVSDHRQKNPSDPLRDIEIVVLIGFFGLHLDREGNEGNEGNDRVDAWALSGIAVRIAVDLGLHKVCYSDRQHRLFCTAYILDRTCAISSGRPMAIPDAAIDSWPETARGWDVLELYRIMSDAYTAESTNASASALWAAAARTRFQNWAGNYCATRQPSRHLSREMDRVRVFLHC